MNSDTNSDMNSDSNIQEAKLRLPLPRLMQELGYGDRAKNNARCMFHDDNNPSFGTFQKEGQWFWKCQAGCGSGDAISFLAKAKGIDNKEGTKEFLRMAGIESNARPSSLSAPKQPAATGDNQAIKRLASLHPLEYERQREKEAEQMGCRVAVLDKLIEAERATPTKDGGSLQGKAVIFSEVEPWPEAVNGAEVLNEIAEAFKRYVALPAGAADMLALWCAHTHCFELFRVSPRLNVTSPTYGCGKSTLRDVVALFVRRPLSAESLTTAVGFRVVEQYRPTLLADEIDRWLLNNEELCGFFNSNYKRGSVFLRCEGENNEVMAFDAYSPTCICGIGELRGRLATLHDRSIAVRMERAKPGELLAPFDESETDREQELNRKLIRWIADSRAALATIKPCLPDGVFNRLADNWRPLFAISGVAGGGWPEQCEKAFRGLSAGKADNEARSIQLLRDIRQVIEDQENPILQEAGESAEKWLPSDGLIERLMEMPESQWAEASKGGKPINARWLALRLGDFGIKPGKLPREGQGQRRGYKVMDFGEAFARYLSCSPVLSGQVSHEPVLRGKNSETHSETDRKTPSVSAIHEGKNASETDGHIGSAGNGVGAKGMPEDASHRVLTNLVDRVQAETRNGLHLKGHPDCQWATDLDVPWAQFYPAEWTGALDYLASDYGLEHSEQKALEHIAKLVYKINAEDLKGTPLVSNGQEWNRRGFYPAELQAAEAYLETCGLAA